MKTISFTIIALLIVLSYWLHYELRTQRKSLKNDIKQLKLDYSLSLDSLKNEIYVKDSIVMDIEGIIKDQKDANRFKRIYNMAK